MSSTSKQTNKKTRRKPTPKQDCELINGRLPDEQTLYDVIKAAAEQYHNYGFETSSKALRDGGQLCLHCGFPLPTKSDRCPNCGTVFTGEYTNNSKNDRTICDVTVFSKQKGETDHWLLLRHFSVDSDIINVRSQPHTFSVRIDEIYRNYISQDGKTVITFRKSLNAFPYSCVNPFNTDSKLHYDAATYYGLTPPYCGLAWDGAVNAHLIKEMDLRLKRRTK